MFHRVRIGASCCDINANTKHSALPFSGGVGIFFPPSSRPQTNFPCFTKDAHTYIGGAHMYPYRRGIQFASANSDAFGRQLVLSLNAGNLQNVIMIRHITRSRYNTRRILGGILRVCESPGVYSWLHFCIVFSLAPLARMTHAIVTRSLYKAIIIAGGSLIFGF